MPVDSSYNQGEDTGIFAVSGTASTSPMVPVLAVENLGNDRILLSWNATPGVQYQVQYVSNLLSNNWLNFGTVITATNSSVAVSDAITNAQRFYRAVALP